MVLLRQLLGDVLRRLRIRQGRTLREVSASARVSLGYLSEVERGRNEASSELLAAICAVVSPGAAISNAVANAIGVRVPFLPLTPDRVLEALNVIVPAGQIKYR